MSENKLGFEKSLYLKQHADNPIHWWAYGQQPLDKARAEGKLIFLSIGYSSCHWCHVMAHESFEDETTAKYLNDNFVAIKVDREEYPDLDHYYQTATSLLTGRGGWPLSVFLTPDGKPFFGGTYFPKTGKQGMPSFMDVMKHIQQAYKTNPTEIIESANNLVAAIKQPPKLENKIEFPGHFPGPSGIMNVLKPHADTKNGGYGQAPKFPHFSFYEWGCEQILEGMIPKEQGQHIVETVEKMMMGGMYDHAKGGIHRYSTDDKFMVPHFEKMLYDQAGLLRVLAKLCQFYPSPLVFDGILQTLDYIRSEMLAEENFFFSAQDADSEGMEGLYFTFSKEEFVASFEDAPEAQKSKIDQFLKIFQITEEGNFEHGLNVLSLNPEMKAEYYSQEGWQEIRDIRRRLLAQRKMRIPPATDRKGIAAWNFMLISALCDVVQYCPIDVMRNEASQLIMDTAEGCFQQFLKVDPKTNHHVLRHTNTLEQQTLYLEDYVSFIEAQLRLYEVTTNPAFKKNALETMDFTLNSFIKDGDIYSVALNAQTYGTDNLIAPLYDQSYKSSAMTMVLLLNRLSVFDAKYAPKSVFGEKFNQFAQFVLTNPLGHGEGLRALTYPDQIYRKVEVPANWIEKSDFQEMRGHFFARFVVDYHNRGDESYQICTREACEATGKGLTELKNLFQVKDSDNA